MKCPHCQQDFVPEVVADSTQVSCPFCQKKLTLDRTAQPMSCPRCHTRMSIENWMLGNPVLCPGCGEAVIPEPEIEQPTLHPGQIIGQYQIVRHLGSGGTAEVYQATQTLLGVDYALKLLKPQVAQSSPLYREQLIREARLACRLQHPNLITVIDANCDPATGWYYIVMDYVNGQSAEELVFQGALPETQVRHITRGVIAALVEAERYNLIHRDIKPANIMIDRQDNIKLADLGLAIQEGVTDGEERTFWGTPNYASPEQLKCLPTVDARSDLYSLGGTMYHLLTGSRPFGEGRPEEIVARVHRGHLPPPQELNPAISPEINALVVQLMAVDPADRPQSAAALQRQFDALFPLETPASRPQSALADFPADPELTAEPAASRGKKWRLTLLVLSLLAGGVWLGTRLWAPAEPDFLHEKASEVPDQMANLPPARSPQPPPVRSSRPVAPRPAVQPPVAPAQPSRPAPAHSQPPPTPPQRAVRPTPKPAPKPHRLQRPRHRQMLTRQQRLEQVKQQLSRLQKQKNVFPERLKFHQRQLAALQSNSAPLRAVRGTEKFSPSHRRLITALSQCANLPLDFPFAATEGERTRQLIRLVQNHQLSPNLVVPTAAGPMPVLALALSGQLPYARPLAAELCRSGANVHQALQHTARFTPEMLAGEDDIEHFQRDGSNLLLRNLIFAGQDVFAAQLQKSVENRRWRPDALKAVNTLLLLNCNVHARLPGGVAPLHLAAGYGLYAIMEKMLWNGADPNVRDHHGDTPLFYAVRCGNRHAARLLIAHGAKVNLRNRRGYKAADYELQGQFARAVFQGRRAQIAQLLKRGCNPRELTALNANALQTLLVFNKLAAAELLLHGKIDLNKTNPQSYAIKVPPLLIALYQNEPAMFRKLLNLGADPNVKVGKIPLLAHLGDALRRSRFSPVEPPPLPYICTLINFNARLSRRGHTFDIAQDILQAAIHNRIPDREIVPLLEALRTKLPPTLLSKWQQELEKADYRNATSKLFAPPPQPRARLVVFPRR